MATFTFPPNIKLPSGCHETTPDVAIRSEMESGYVLSRPRFTRTRRKWKISWELLWGEDYNMLLNFYHGVKGGAYSFSWTHPLENKIYQVRFAGDLAADCDSYNWWRVEFNLEQV